MSKTFIQSQWGTVCGVNMGISGCGPSSMACITYNIDTGINPKKTGTWLYNAGVFSSAGTTRAGMTAALNHYGFDNIYYKPEHQGGAAWRAAMEKMKNAKGDWWAIFLVVGTKNGGKDNLWTSGGHFISITDYKNGKLYVRDSGARGRTGYYDPETLRYDTNCIWFIRKKNDKVGYNGTFPTLPSKGYLKEGDKGDQVKYLQLFLNWYGGYNIPVDKSFGPKTYNAVIAFQKANRLKDDGWFGPACLKKAKEIKK